MLIKCNYLGIVYMVRGKPNIEIFTSTALSHAKDVYGSNINRFNKRHYDIAKFKDGKFIKIMVKNY